MTKTNKYLPLILFALCVIGWVACTQERDPCLTPKIAILNVETQHLPTDTATVFVDTALPAAVFTPITTIPNIAGTLYPPQALFTLSLSPDSTVCKWSFTADTATNKFDTITFYYQKSLKFLSNACGYTYFYNIDSVQSTHNIIDSIHILNASVTNNVNTNQLQICIHTHF